MSKQLRTQTPRPAPSRFSSPGRSMSPPVFQLKSHRTPDGTPVKYLNDGYYGAGAKKTFDDTLGLLNDKGLKASSEIGGEKREGMTFAEFAQICPEIVQDRPDKAKLYHEHLNDALRAMQIDTAEAQAMFVAQSYIETGHYAAFTESQTRSTQYEDDPGKIRMDLNGLKKSYTRQDGTVSNSYNRMARNGYAWVGRSPLQVTFQDNFAKAMAVLELRAQQLCSEVARTGDPQANREWTLINEALEKIGEDPKNASRPEYGFLLSAAYAKLPNAKSKTEFESVSGVDKAHHMKMGGQPANQQQDLQQFVDVGSKFMTGGNLRYGDKKWRNNTNRWRTKFIKKKEIYDRALKVLGQQSSNKAKAGP